MTCITIPPKKINFSDSLKLIAVGTIYLIKSKFVQLILEKPTRSEWVAAFSASGGLEPQQWHRILQHNVLYVWNYFLHKHVSSFPFTWSLFLKDGHLPSCRLPSSISCKTQSWCPTKKMWNEDNVKTVCNIDFLNISCWYLRIYYVGFLLP